MNFSYQITKYNPAYRNEQGWYLKDDWSCYSDIGKKYNNEIVTLDDYLKVENAYVQAVLEFMKCNKVTSFQVTRIEKDKDPLQDPRSTQEMIAVYNNIKNRSLISGKEIEAICKLSLRGFFWSLIRNKNMEVRFAYDYYMFVKSKLMCKKAITMIEKSGLFVDEYKF